MAEARGVDLQLRTHRRCRRHARRGVERALAGKSEARFHRRLVAAVHGEAEAEDHWLVGDGLRKELVVIG